MSDVFAWFFGGGIAVIGGLLALLLKISFKLGHDAREIRDGLTRITKLEEHMSQIPILTVRINQLERAHESTREDIRDLIRHNAHGSEE
jgi:hypothetical protein